MNESQKNVHASLTRMFRHFRWTPSPEHLADWADLFKHYPPKAIHDCVERVRRSERRYCPNPGEFRALLTGGNTPMAIEAKPTPNQERDGQVSSVGALLDKSHPESIDDVVMAVCAEGREEFETTRWYVQTLAKLRAPVLCYVHAGEHLDRVGECKSKEREYATPILVRITRDGVRPTQHQVDVLHRNGFGHELNSRLAKAGGLVRETR